MADALGFAPDAEIRCRDYRIGCIGAGFIMADVHLAAYKEAGFPVVAIASRTPEKAAEVAKRWGIGRVHATPEALIEDPEVEIVDIAFPPDQQPALIRHALQAAAHQGDPGAEAARDGLRDVQAVARRGEGGRQDAVGQPEHALRPVDARAQADAGPRRAGRAGDRHDRDAGDPALAALPAAVRPADAAQHEHPPPGRAALPVRRPDRDHTAARPDPRTTFEHTDGITVSTLQVPVAALLAVSMEDVWSGPREEGFKSDIYINWRVEGTEGAGQGHDRLAGLPGRQPSTLRYASARDHRRRMGRAELGHDVVPARLHGRHGAAAGRAGDRHASRR